MRARYQTLCPLCQRLIVPGEEIEMADGRAVHSRCLVRSRRPLKAARYGGQCCGCNKTLADKEGFLVCGHLYCLDCAEGLR